MIPVSLDENDLESGPQNPALTKSQASLHETPSGPLTATTQSTQRININTTISNTMKDTLRNDHVTEIDETTEEDQEVIVLNSKNKKSALKEKLKRKRSMGSKNETINSEATIDQEENKNESIHQENSLCDNS